MPRIGSKGTVPHMLMQREMCIMPCPYRVCLKILRQLVCDKSSTFNKIWETTSKQPITCEDGKIYMENYSECFALCGKQSLPCFLYKFPLEKIHCHSRIEDALVYTGPVHRITSSVDDSKSFFLALHVNNWLYCHDNMTGRILHKIYLGSPSRNKYKHVDWETHGESVILQSVHNQGDQQHHSNVSGKPRVLVTMAVFTVFPLQFKAALEIDRQIFGKECIHVNVSEGLLVIGTGSSLNGTVRLYNFKDIVEQSLLYPAKLNEPCKELDGALVGTYPVGLPLNCKLKEAPPVLFEVKCSEFMLHFGGYPWHYITTPPKKEGIFQVRSVETGVLVENGNLDFPNNSTEPDSLVFHPDDSGRLVYNSSHSVKFYRLMTNGKSQSLLKELFDITFAELIEKEVREVSGRRQRAVRKRFDPGIINVCEKSILSDDYENELELYGVLGFNPRDEECHGKICIFDNDTGQKLKTVDLGLCLDELSDYTLTMDLDTLVILVKTGSTQRSFSCHVYRLSFPDLDVKQKRVSERQLRQRAGKNNAVVRQRQRN